MSLTKQVTSWVDLPLFIFWAYYFILFLFFFQFIIDNKIWQKKVNLLESNQKMRFN